MEAIRKVTLLPAQRLEKRAPAFRAKGRVRVGADADLTLFDPERVEGPRDLGVARARSLRGFPVRAGRRRAWPSSPAGRLVPNTFPGQGLRAPMR